VPRYQSLSYVHRDILTEFQKEQEFFQIELVVVKNLHGCPSLVKHSYERTRVTKPNRASTRVKVLLNWTAQTVNSITTPPNVFAITDHETDLINHLTKRSQRRAASRFEQDPRANFDTLLP
jgi:hypothetical protein